MKGDMHGLVIEVVRGGEVVDSRRFDPLRRRPLKIGSLPSADIRLEPPGVAPIHAVLTAAGRKVYAVAVDNREGIEVNGVRTHRAPIADGDEISVGDALLRVRLDPNRREEAAVPSRAAAPVAVPAPEAPLPNLDTPPRDLAAPPASGSERITREHLRRPAVEDQPHPALPPESPVTPAHRALEMRIYMGQVLLDMFHYVCKPRITIGESREADVFLSSEGLPAQVFPLLRFDEGDYVLTFTSDMEGEVEIAGQTLTLAEVLTSGRGTLDPELPGCFRVRLNLRARAIVHWGGVTFALRFVPPPRPVATRRFIDVDHGYAKTLALSVALHVTLVLTLLLSPFNPRAIERRELADAVVTLYAPTAIPAAYPPEQPSTRRRRGTSREATPAPQGPKPPRHSRASRHSGTPSAADVRRRIEAVLAGTTGEILAGGDPGLPIAAAIAGVIGSRGQRNAAGSLVGGQLRGQRGLFSNGLGQSRGIGQIATTSCLGSADCDGFAALGRHHSRQSEIGVLELDEPTVTRQALPKEVIRRVINQSRGQIRACYERELQRNHDLEGKIAVKWIIGATGAVARVLVVENTMGNRAVARCVSERIERWRFPAPAGGGTVEVNYPFIFHAI